MPSALEDSGACETKDSIIIEEMVFVNLFLYLLSDCR